MRRIKLDYDYRQDLEEMSMLDDAYSKMIEDIEEEAAQTWDVIECHKNKMYIFGNGKGEIRVISKFYINKLFA